MGVSPQEDGQPLTVGCPGERHSRPRFPMVPHLKLASHAARQSWRKPLLPASRHNEVLPQHENVPFVQRENVPFSADSGRGLGWGTRFWG
jgi:hypothetical protein